MFRHADVVCLCIVCILWQFLVYGACLFYVGCSDCVGVCGNVCCVAAVVKNSVFLALEC